MRRLSLPNLLLSSFGHQFTTLKKLEKGFVAKVTLSQRGGKEHSPAGNRCEDMWGSVTLLLHTSAPIALGTDS